MPVEHHTRWPEKFCTIRRHGGHEHYALEPSARTSGCMAEVGLSIIIPQRTGIYKSPASIYPHRSLPFSKRVLSFHHKDPPVGVSAIDVEPSVVIADCRSPYAVSVLDTGDTLWLELVCVISKGSTNEFPIDEVFRMKDRKSWKIIE